MIRGVAAMLWEPLMTLPVPWRAAIIVLVGQAVGYGLVVLLGRRVVRTTTLAAWYAAEGVGAALLLPEFLLTRRLRAAGHDPLPGSYAIGDGIQAVARRLMTLHERAAAAQQEPRKPKKHWKVTLIAALLVASVPVLAWAARPHVQERGFLQGYIDGGIERWCALEGWVFEHGSAGRWRCERELRSHDVQASRPTHRRARQQ